MARSTRSRRTTTKQEDTEKLDTPNQDVEATEKATEKKTRRGRKHEVKEPVEQTEDTPKPKENSSEAEGTVQQPEGTEKGRRGRKKREVTEAEGDVQRSSSAKKVRPQRGSGDPTDGDGAKGKEKREECVEQVKAVDEPVEVPKQREEEQGKEKQLQKGEHKEEENTKEVKKDSKRHGNSNEERRERTNKSKSAKATPSENQETLRMEVEEEKLDFEIEDELQLKVQNDEVLDGDDEEPKEEDEGSQSNETSFSKKTKESKADPEKDSVSSEKLNALDEMLKRRASRRNHWTSDKEGGADKDKENLKDAPRDPWGKLAGKSPSKEHAQAIVTTDSLKELSKELEAKVVKKESSNETESAPTEEKKSPVATEGDKPVIDGSAPQTGEAADVLKKKVPNDPGLEDRRRARHISMTEITMDISAKDSTKDSGHQSGRSKPPSAGLALGSTNWTELEATRRKARESATPPRSAVSRHLLVLNLVRPFTLCQLTDLVTHSGTRAISGLWLDRIKSKAIVEFADDSSSQEARDELHNIVWPKGSPKTIKCEFLTEEEVEETKTGTTPSTKAEASTKDSKEKNKKETTKERTRIVMGPSEETRDNGDLRRTIEIHKEKSGDDSTRRRPLAAEDDIVPPKKIREWDLPKLKQQQSQQQPPQQHEAEEPVTTKRLEDLFRKTKATPNIYWIPLPENVAVEKAKMRAEKQKEEDRRNRNRWLIN